MLTENDQSITFIRKIEQNDRICCSSYNTLLKQKCDFCLCLKTKTYAFSTIDYTVGEKGIKKLGSINITIHKAFPTLLVELIHSQVLLQGFEGAGDHHLDCHLPICQCYQSVQACLHLKAELH